LVIFGNGEQTRDFVFVSDVVQALIATLGVDDSGHRTINIGSGTEVSIRELAREVLSQTGSSSNVIYSPVKGGGVSRLRADLTLAQRVLGYQPEVTLSQGIQRILQANASS
jgi:UDP-glucose 4-epimerase